MTKVDQFDIWTADLDPSAGTEPGKLRPVIIAQSNILNWEQHGSTIICPLSSQSKQNISALRIDLQPNRINGLSRSSYILCDQIRAIDNSRLKERIGQLDIENIEKLKRTLKAILSLY